MNLYRTKLSEKLKESLEVVVPIILMAFIIEAILLVVGMMSFTLGAEMSMYRGRGYHSLFRLAAWAEERHCSFL